MSYDPRIEPNWLLTVRIYQANHLLYKLWARRLKESNMTLEKLAILHEISHFEGNPTPHAIARITVFEPATISATINRLVKDGFVTKSKDLAYKHMVRIELTALGKEVLKKTRQDLVNFNNNLPSFLPKQEEDQLIDALPPLIDTLLPLVFSGGRKLRENMPLHED